MTAHTITLPERSASARPLPRSPMWRLAVWLVLTCVCATVAVSSFGASPAAAASYRSCASVTSSEYQLGSRVTFYVSATRSCSFARRWTRIIVGSHAYRLPRGYRCAVRRGSGGQGECVRGTHRFTWGVAD